jgi:hypothetical protein
MTHAFRWIGLTVTLLALMGVSTAAQAQTAPKDMVPFKMVAATKLDAASFTLILDHPVVYGKFVGTVEGSPLGLATAIQTDRTHVGVDGTRLWFEGQSAWTAANGDAVYFTYVGLPYLTAGAFVITGGKGRFQGATGSGVYTYTRNVERTVFVATFDGYISAPKP